MSEMCERVYQECLKARNKIYEENEHKRDLVKKTEELIKRKGARIMKRLPFEINQRILSYLEDERGINIITLKNWRIFIDSVKLCDRCMYGGFNNLMNCQFETTEYSILPADGERDMVYLTETIRETIMSGYFSSIKRKELIRFDNGIRIDDEYVNENMNENEINFDYINITIAKNNYENSGKYRIRVITDNEIIGEYSDLLTENFHGDNRLIGLITAENIYNCLTDEDFPTYIPLNLKNIKFLHQSEEGRAILLKWILEDSEEFSRLLLRQIGKEKMARDLEHIKDDYEGEQIYTIDLMMRSERKMKYVMAIRKEEN
jgi:hypothetical protein